MKKDMNNRMYYYETFQEVHAPGALAGKVMNMTNHKNKKSSIVKKLAVTAASLAVLFLGSNAIVYAATGTTWVSGFFKDTMRWDGAVIGTEYVATTGEIDITVSDIIEKDDIITIPVTIRFTDAEKVPFKTLEQLSPAEILLIDNAGTEIPLAADISQSVCTPIISGTAQLNLTYDADTLQSNTTYILHIESLYGSSKADAPLLIHVDQTCPLQ